MAALEVGPTPRGKRDADPDRSLGSAKRDGCEHFTACLSWPLFFTGGRYMSQKDQISALNARAVRSFAALTPGAEVRCPQCGGWHVVTKLHSEGTPYTRRMLYFECNGGRYFAGTEGHAKKHVRHQVPRPL
jgi:hypothetical protein